MVDLAQQTQSIEFGGFGGPDPFKEEVINTAFTELKDIKSAAESVVEATQRAKKSGDSKTLKYLRGLARDIFQMMVTFVENAIRLAIFKFVIELCAQIVQSLVQAMVDKNQKPVEISTPGVYFTVPGQQAQQTPTTNNQQRPSSFDNPFGDVFNRRSSW